MKTKKILLGIGCFCSLLTTTNRTESASTYAASGYTNTIQKLNASETMKKAKELDKNLTTITKIKIAANKNYMQTSSGSNVYTSNNLEINKRAAYSEFTGYVFYYNGYYASESMSFNEYTSTSVSSSASIGVYASASTGFVSGELETSVGVTGGVSHTISYARILPFDGLDSGYYGLMIRFYVCDKLYLKFSGNNLVSGIYSINNPSTTVEFYLTRRNA